jgi:hypothetical protein
LPLFSLIDFIGVLALVRHWFEELKRRVPTK